MGVHIFRSKVDGSFENFELIPEVIRRCRGGDVINVCPARVIF